MDSAQHPSGGSPMRRRAVAPGVTLHHQQAARFKRCLISLDFVLPGGRETATDYALLPMVLGRGWAGCPDMTELSRRLAVLYGAQLSVWGSGFGPNRILTVQVSGLRNAYAVQGEDLLEGMLEHLFGVAFYPDAHDGGFDEQAVRIEKDKLRERQAARINNKRRLCMDGALHLFFGDDPAGVEPNGYPQDLPALTPQRLYEAWRRMVCTARLEVTVLNAPVQPVLRRLRAALRAAQTLAQKGEGRPAPLLAAHAMPAVPLAEGTLPVQAAQGRLCMLYTLPALPDAAAAPALQMAVALFGASPTSRLFTRVREQQSLCYYCNAGYARLGGYVFVECGVDFADMPRARQAIQAQLDELCAGGITAQEVQQTRRYLRTALQGVQDSLGSIAHWTVGEALQGTLRTPAQAAQQLEGVSAQDMAAALRGLHLNAVYTLSQGGAARDR